MNQPSVRFRRTPKTPFVAGNILLAAFAASLVFFGPDPWSIATVLMVALCLATGGLLTLLPFLLDQFAILNVQRSRTAQSAMNLKGALERSEAILAELREHGAEDNPLRLVSERLPELVRTKLAEALEQADSEAAGKREEIRSGIEALRTLPEALERLHDDVRTLSAHAATRERVATGMDRLSEEIHGINVRIEELRRIRLFGTPVEGAPADIVHQKEEPAATDEEHPTRPAPEPETEPTPVPEKNASPPEPKDRREPAVPTESAAVDEPERNPDAAAGKTPDPARKKNRPTSIVVSAFVGIRNGVHLRGNGAGLSPETGIRLEMTGIGEWTWSGEPGESFTAELFLNDETPSDIGPFTVNPGDTLKLNPSFPTISNP